MPSTPTSQYASKGLQMPMKRNKKTEEKSIKEPINEYNTILDFLPSTMRRRNRQIEVLVSMRVMKVWIQSAHPRTANILLWPGCR